MSSWILIVVALSLSKAPRTVTVSELAEGRAAPPATFLLHSGRGKRETWSLPARTAAVVTGWFTRYLPTIHECPVVLVSMQLRLQVGSCLTWLWLTLGLTHQHTPCVYSAVCWVIDWILWTRMNLRPYTLRGKRNLMQQQSYTALPTKLWVKSTLSYRGQSPGRRGTSCWSLHPCGQTCFGLRLIPKWQGCLFAGRVHICHHRSSALNRGVFSKTNSCVILYVLYKVKELTQN